MNSPSRKETAQVLLAHFEPRLAEHGFKWLTSKGVFKRDCGVAQQEIAFKLSTYQPQEVRLELILGSRALAKFLNRKVYTFDTFSPSRIPNWDDRGSSFGVYHTDGTRECAGLRQLSQELFRTGIPFLDRMSSAEELLRFYVTPAEIHTRKNLVVHLCLFLNSKEWAEKALGVWEAYKVSAYALQNFHSLEKPDREIREALGVLLLEK